MQGSVLEPVMFVCPAEFVANKPESKLCYISIFQGLYVSQLDKQQKYEGNSISMLSNMAFVKYVLIIVLVKCRGRRTYGQHFSRRGRAIDREVTERNATDRGISSNHRP